MITEEFGIRAVQSYTYLKIAEKEIREHADKSRDEWVREHIAIRRDLMKQASASGDLKMLLAAADSEARLLGLYIDKHEVTGKDGEPIGGGKIIVVEQIVRKRSDLESKSDAEGSHQETE